MKRCDQSSVVQLRSIWQYYCNIAPMNLSLIASLLLAIAAMFSNVEYKQLIGSWQLTHFEGMDKIMNSSQYQRANAMERASMDAKIAFRLENTVYHFEPGELLKFTDFEDQQVVQKEAKIEIENGDMLVIHEEKGDRFAKIVEFTDQKMVLQPVSKNSVSGKLTFERIK
jgi:hypothetical protein